MENGPDVIFVIVYMPYNDNSVDYFDEFEVAVGSMQRLVDKYIGCKFVFGGDRNISKTSNNRTANTLDGFCRGNCFTWLDHVPNGTYTFHDDVSNKFSMIDYFVCSSDLTASSVGINILNDGDNNSDHLAIVCQFTVKDILSADKCDSFRPVKLLCDKADLDVYQSLLSQSLSQIALPADALLCTLQNCQQHTVELEHYYCDIVHCLHISRQYVPRVKAGFHKHWWHPDLDDLKQKCIDITTLWSSVGRPHSGLINDERLKCKYRYKQAIKAAMQESDKAFNDDLCDHLCQKDDVSF